jgi:hypothetical protein
MQLSAHNSDRHSIDLFCQILHYKVHCNFLVRYEF